MAITILVDQLTFLIVVLGRRECNGSYLF